MDAALERLTIIQKININKPMFELAYDCVVKSKGSDYSLNRIISEKPEKLQPDIIRYCKLVKKVM